MKRHLFAALMAASCAAQADDTASLLLRLQGEATEAAAGNPFHLQDSHRYVRSADLRWQWDAPLQTAIRGVLSARSAGGEENRLTMSELSFERALAGGFVTAGKKVMSWDVGYAFRPLDVVQQQDRRALYTGTLEGVPLLAWEHFDAEHALTLVWSNPTRGQAAAPRDDEAFAARLYRRAGSRDEYFVLRTSQRDGAQGGASFSDVLNDGLEVHASVLLQQRHGDKAMAGVNWTTESKFSLIAEAWLDRSAAAGAQRNVFVRAAQNEGDFDAYADLVWQQQDGSRIASIGASYKAGPWAWSASYRHYGGPAGIAMRASAVVTAERAF